MVSVPDGVLQTMRRVAAAALFLAVLPALPARAQVVTDVRLDFSPQLFTVLSMLRAGAPELAPILAPESPVTAAVDEYLGGLDPAVIAPIRSYLRNRDFRGTHDELTGFVSLALLLQGPPDFDFVLPRQQLPPDVLPLIDFQPLVRDFYRGTRIESVRQRVVGEYAEVIRRSQPLIAASMLETRGFIRLVESRSLTSIYVVYPEWLLPSGLASARNYARMYFLAVHPGNEDFVGSVRHQYLHFLLDSFIEKHQDEMSDFADVAQAFVDRVPRLPDTFRRDALLLIGESLIQAIEMRMQPPAEDQWEAEFKRREEDGFLFVRHFAERVEKFEQGVESISLVFPELFSGYPVKKETARLSKLQFPDPDPVPEPVRLPPPPPPDPAEPVLREAERALREGDHDAARRAFERVLTEFDTSHDRAQYGLGLIASAQGYRVVAADHFKKVLEMSRQATLRGWSNLYLGRIYDLEGLRDEAVGYYQAALDAGSGNPRIEEAARKGLQEPFGGQ